MEATKLATRETLLQILDELPVERQAEVLDFALFLKQRLAARKQRSSKLVAKGIPASRLMALAGIVSWGGDAVEDTERLYSDDE